jgi:hypothetical protein
VYNRQRFVTKSLSNFEFFLKDFFFSAARQKNAKSLEACSGALVLISEFDFIANKKVVWGILNEEFAGNAVFKFMWPLFAKLHSSYAVYGLNRLLKPAY